MLVVPIAHVEAIELATVNAALSRWGIAWGRADGRMDSSGGMAFSSTANLWR